jgi:hypothetical protein
MQRLLITCAAASVALALTSAPVAAQSTTGTIVINGTVTAKCAAVPGGATFGDTVGLSELADSNGALVAALTGSSAAAPAFSRSFSLTCTGANFGVSVEAQALANTDVGLAPTGYARAADFTGRVSLDLVSPSAGASTLNLDDSSAVAGASTGSSGPANFLANSTGNVRVSGYGFSTPAGAIMVAGPYEGRIIITVSPS